MIPGGAAPPAELVPKPSVSNWKPVAINFGNKPATSAATSSATTTTASTTATTEKKEVPKAFSIKPFSFSATAALGNPPMPAEASADGKDSTETTDATEKKEGTSTASAPTATDAASSDAASTTGASPLAKPGFKFAVSTTWSFGPKTPVLGAGAPAATDGTSDAPKAAPATTMKWNFAGNKPPAAPAKTATDFKPGLLSTHFVGGAKSTAATGFKPFQFGKNIAPAKPSEPSKEVLESLDKASSSVDSKAALIDSTPVTISTGDENEDHLFKADAKLMEFDLNTKIWVERGVGSFKINQLKDESNTNKIQKYRMLMHMKTTFKLILNSFVYVGMTATAIDNPTVVKFSATPMPIAPKKEEDAAAPAAAEDSEASKASAQPAAAQPAISLFTIRFRDAETAALCLKTINDALAAKAADQTVVAAPEAKAE